jgi:hypothetical protein
MIFIGIILVTIPFYCAGILLWGTAPRNQPQDAASATPPQTLPPTLPGQPTITPLPITLGAPTEFIPTAVIPTIGIPTILPPTAVIPTRYVSPTPTVMIPTATPPPPPTATPPIIIPPTSVLPTDFTPLPFDTPSSP